MHQRIFHYAMLVYAFGFVTALTLNVDVSDRTADALVKAAVPEQPSATSNAMIDCGSQPDVHVVSSGIPAPDLEPVGIETPCLAAPLREVVPLPGAARPKPATIPAVEPSVRQEL